jgi:hypothetical protein
VQVDPRFAVRHVLDKTDDADGIHARLARRERAVVTSLGHEHAGLFSNNDQLSERMTSAFRSSWADRSFVYTTSLRRC